MAASRSRLARAVSFIARRLTPVVLFRIAESDQLRGFLKKHYPMPEVSCCVVATRFAEMAGDAKPADN